MFTIDNQHTKFPLKVWLDSREQIEDSCLEQAYNLSQLPFVHQWVCLMPDTHMGMGMPIGGVLATDGVIIPNAVGVDIGCGMAFVSTNIAAEILRSVQTANGTLIQAIIGDILRNIPLGFHRHKTIQPCRTMDTALAEIEKYAPDKELLGLLEAGRYQVGTLGGGNHFIELQEDEQGYLNIMIHSGSRNVGKTVCDYFHNQARQLNKQWHSAVPEEYRLAFLPVDSPVGKQYIHWMNLSLDFARENRDSMLAKVQSILEKWLAPYIDEPLVYSDYVNCHHNYASLENHYGKNVWVHRKGATRAFDGEMAVIPGAMGSYSYLVKGLGNRESFCSCSHGAGRRYSRKGAMEAFTCEQVMLDLKEQEVTLGKTKKSDIAEESRFAYKDIEEVMRHQTDLVLPVKKLKTIGVVKG